MKSARLFVEWRERPAGRLPVETYRTLGKEANACGESLLAVDVAGEGLVYWAEDVLLRQQLALAFARMGSTNRARELLVRIQNDGADDEETAGLLARTYKDVYEKTGDVQDLRTAFEAYLRAYNHAPDRYWTGINAATLAFSLRDVQKSHELAGQVLRDCEKLRADAADSPDYWLTATIAEAHLLLDQVEAAETAYRAARAIGTLGSLLSTWRNAEIILRWRPGHRSRIEAAFHPPKVVVVREDWTGGGPPVFSQVRPEDAGAVYCAAATHAGVDYLEAVQTAGGSTYIVLPHKEEQFIVDRKVAVGDEWEPRYRKVREAATDVITCSDHDLKFGAVDNEYASDVMHGLAKIRARYLCTKLLLIGDSGRRGVTELMSGIGTVRRAMIFADVFHFSHLTDDQMPAFIRGVVDRIAALSRNAEVKPEFQNTWGDGLFFVFESVAEAGRFALKLVASIAAIRHESAGLPAKPVLRIGLHAGPVYKFPDELIGKENYIGSHVNRAARIEPIAPPGEIYASDAFAALATLEAAGQFQFDYVGRKPLAKDFGAWPMYQLRAVSD